MKNTVFSIWKTVSINSAKTAAYTKKNYRKTKKTLYFSVLKTAFFILSTTKFSFLAVFYPSKSFIKESISSSL